MPTGNSAPGIITLDNTLATDKNAAPASIAPGQEETLVFAQKNPRHMRGNQSDKADDADKTDGRRRHYRHQHQRFQAQKLQIDAQPDGAFFAQSAAQSLPHIARKQKTRIPP